MSLPLLPHEHVHRVFEMVIADIGEDVPALGHLVGYMRTTWLEGAVFRPHDWVVFGQSTRTNNDLEGWHYRLNHHAKRGIYIYIKSI